MSMPRGQFSKYKITAGYAMKKSGIYGGFQLLISIFQIELRKCFFNFSYYYRELLLIFVSHV